MLAKNKSYNLCVIDKVLPQTPTNIGFFPSKALFRRSYICSNKLNHSQNGTRPPMYVGSKDNIGSQNRTYTHINSLATTLYIIPIQN